MSVKLTDKLSPAGQTSRPASRGGRRSLHLSGQTYTPVVEDEKKSLRWATAVAIGAHVILLVLTFPEIQADSRDATIRHPHYVVQPVRFKPPAPRQAQQKIPKPKTRKVPIPDPTPDAPEPILEEELAIEPEIDFDSLGEVLDIPPAPPGGTAGPMWVKGDVTPPEKVYFPQPRYTEEARKARIQGVVILQAVIDAQGRVERVKIVKDLPQGLGDSAVQTVKQWKFKPASLQGEPVPVYFNLTITFSLQ